jgi:transcriptional regulator with PAS, ATPase and Fis domain
MPALIATDNQSGGNSFANEREILYKLFFDMKKDVTELKKMFLEILKNPSIAENISQSEMLNTTTQDIANYSKNIHSVVQKSDTPYIITDVPKEPLHEVKEYDESLNLMEKEKEFIIKSLKKHKKKRRDAAKELGISERTLYRKIKDYNLEEY